jgi:hypothetical protein
MFWVILETFFSLFRRTPDLTSSLPLSEVERIGNIAVCLIEVNSSRFVKMLTANREILGT